MTRLERWHIDKPLFSALLILSAVSLIVLYSASAQNLEVLGRHFLRLLIGFAVLFLVAQIRPETFARWSPPLFIATLLLLLGVLAFGAIYKGAQRWIDLGFVTFQPSELMKLALPMMLAWYFSRQPMPPKLYHVLIGGVVTVVPSLLIAKQPDLGTAFLVFGAGLCVLFLAGMGWRTIIVLLTSAAAVVPLLWGHMHDYQRQRILTLFNPESDPLGTGYHTMQAMIAVGSGGFYGKGWLNSTQAHLEFLPESATDFVFAVFAEEFGLIGILLLLGLYFYIVMRALTIAFYAQDAYSRLLAGAIGLTFFLYFFINIGMVTGILPVVGIPLPMLSYGGTSMITLMTGFGALMSIHTHRKLVL